MIRFLFTFFFLLSIIASYSINIQGVVRDAQTGELLIGANVFVKNYKTIGTTSGLDGSFILKNVQAEKVVLVCSYISYQILELEVNVPTNGIQKLALNLVSIDNELNDVIVTASNKTTDVGVRAIERLSSSILNVVGARSIEISPDLTVANVLGRISGVTMERNSSGEAEYAVLRGMDKRYNITLVNGVKISSPNNKQRFVPLNIFPSELLDRLEVSKTRNAEMEGDATGGAVNMVMKDAPYRFTLKANLTSGYSSMLFNKDFSTFNKENVLSIAPYEKYGKDYISKMEDFGNSFNAPVDKQPLPNLIAGFSVGSRIFHKKLGFIVAANYHNINKGTNSTYFDHEMLYTESTVRLTEHNERTYSENQTQYGIHAKLDYKISNNHKLEWYNFYVSNGVSQVRQSNSINLKATYQPDLGNLDYSYQTRMRITNQQIFVSTLQGEHNFFDRLSLNWTALYSEAGLQRPDQTYVNIDNLQESFVDNIEIDGDGSDRRWEHNSDQDVSALAKLKYEIPYKNGKIYMQLGGLIRTKKRDNFYVNYKFKPIDTSQSFETIDQINWKVYTTKGSVGPLTYNANESIEATYFDIRNEYKKIDIIAGIRAEKTNQGYKVAYPKANEPADSSQTYTDFLPNLQFKYSPNKNTNWKLIYYKSLNRPGFFEIIPYQIIEEEYTEYGNKNLKRAIIDNVDLRWEFFPNSLDQILIGTFYKNINDPIEFAYFSVNQRQSGYGLQNLGNARNLGFEIDIIKYVRMFGVKANYTYTNSDITTPKVYYGKDENGNTKTFSKNQSRPLVGQAEHVANLSLFFKDVNHGWNAQVSALYTGDKIVIASRYLDSDYWEKASVQLDASAEKDFKNGISVFFKANNILNTPKIEVIKSINQYNIDKKFPLQSATNNETLIRKDYYGFSFNFGIRYKL